MGWKVKGVRVVIPPPQIEIELKEHGSDRTLKAWLDPGAARDLETKLGDILDGLADGVELIEAEEG